MQVTTGSIMYLQMSRNLIVFSDLDGCLLNKHDYDWRAARPAMERLQELEIPVVLSSSKTAAEISDLAETLPLIAAPFIAENGGTIDWGPWAKEGEPAIEQSEIDRDVILTILAKLRDEFQLQFRSFHDLGLEGVMTATDLNQQAAQRALQRHSTEPLLWDDTPENIKLFATELNGHGLVLTKGGRFWHVSGPTTKGRAMARVHQRFSATESMSVAIGDSPIDQSMLDIADVPVGITVAGKINVTIDRSRGIVPEQEGSAGWNEALTAILNRIQ